MVEGLIPNYKCGPERRAEMKAKSRNIVRNADLKIEWDTLILSGKCFIFFCVNTFKPFIR